MERENRDRVREGREVREVGREKGVRECGILDIEAKIPIQELPPQHTLL